MLLLKRFGCLALVLLLMVSFMPTSAVAKSDKDKANDKADKVKDKVEIGSDDAPESPEVEDEQDNGKPEKSKDKEKDNNSFSSQGIVQELKEEDEQDNGKPEKSKDKDKDNKSSQGIGQEVKEYVSTVLEVGKGLRGGNITKVGELIRNRVHELQMLRETREKQEKEAKVKMNETFQRAGGMFGNLNKSIGKLKGIGADTGELEETISEIRYNIEQAEENYGEDVSDAARHMNAARELLQQFKEQFRETVQKNRRAIIP